MCVSHFKDIALILAQVCLRERKLHLTLLNNIWFPSIYLPLPRGNVNAWNNLKLPLFDHNKESLLWAFFSLGIACSGLGGAVDSAER